MFIRGNSKLGPSVYTFSIPAKKTCPDSTETCRRICYATGGRYLTHHVSRLLTANAVAARRNDFDRIAAAEIVTKKITLLRVHVAGDLFSVAYAKAWVRIMRQCPETTFWLYTRGWRSPKLRPVLRQMAALRNVRLWFSADTDTGLPRHRPRRVRVAWLMTTPSEISPGPVDLVFRTKPLKRIQAVMVPAGSTAAPVCPTETGLPDAKSVTCQTCQKCFEPLPGDASVSKVLSRIPLTVVAPSLT